MSHNVYCATNEFTGILGREYVNGKVSKLLIIGYHFWSFCLLTRQVFNETIFLSKLNTKGVSKNMLYRILTENINKNGITELTSRLFEAFTLYEGVGFWRGTKENNLTIELDTDQVSKVKLLASRIKRLNTQEAVLIQTLNIMSALV